MQVQPSTSRQAYVGDRYIPMRRGYSFEKAHYLLTRDMNSDIRRNNIFVIDVRKQIKELEITYRRRAMRAALVQFYLQPEFRLNRVLRLSNSTAECKGDLLGADTEEKNWNCKPRQKKLIGSPDEIFTVPNCNFIRDYFPHVDSVVDWSNLNILVIASLDKLMLLPNSMLAGHTYMSIRMIVTDFIKAIKCNNNGSKIMISLQSGRLVLMDIVSKTYVWESYCLCYMFHDFNCHISMICWSGDDKKIIVACNSMLIIYDSHNGQLIKCVKVHRHIIDAMAFSSDFQYFASIVTTGILRVFKWPDFSLIFTAQCCGIIKAIAWHPKEPIICTGNNRGTLMFWHVKKKTKLGVVNDKYERWTSEVNHLIWNKLSGELVVHLIHIKENRWEHSISVFSNFNRIVDAVPLSKEMQLSSLMFNHAHDKLGLYEALRITQHSSRDNDPED